MSESFEKEEVTKEFEFEVREVYTDKDILDQCYTMAKPSTPSHAGWEIGTGKYISQFFEWL